MNNGRIITISGLDGSGKSTQKRLLIQKLVLFDKPIRYVKVRIGFTAGFQILRGDRKKRRVRKIERRKSGIPKNESRKTKDSRIYKLYLQFALFDMIWTLLRTRWLRWRDVIVVCDRYIWDNYILIKEKLPSLDLENWFLWKTAKLFALEPDFSVLLSLPAEVAYDRIVTRAGGVESQSLEALAKREEYYSSINNQTGWIVLSAVKPVDDLAEEIWQRVQKVMP